MKNDKWDFFGTQCIYSVITVLNKIITVERLKRVSNLFISRMSEAEHGHDWNKHGSTRSRVHYYVSLHSHTEYTVDVMKRIGPIRNAALFPSSDL